MNVAVSQAIPNSAMAEIMPALNTDWSGTVFTSGRPTNRMMVPTTNMTRTMVVVMSIDTTSPSTSKDGRRLGKRPRITMATTPRRKTNAELRPSLVYVRAEALEAGSAGGADAVSGGRSVSMRAMSVPDSGADVVGASDATAGVVDVPAAPEDA